MNPRQALRAVLPFRAAIGGVVVAAALLAGAPLVAQGIDTAPAGEIAPGIYRLSGIDEDLPSEELEPLRRMLRRAEVVGLGEAFHATRGFSRAKFRLFKYLVETAGFRVFAFESPWIDAERVAMYVETCEGSAEKAVEGLVGVWRNESVVELVEWMCAYNRENPDDPVAFYGFDHQQAWHDAPALKELLISFGIAARSPRVEWLDDCEGATSRSATAYWRERAVYVPEAKHQRCMEALSRDWRFLTHRARRMARDGEIDGEDVAWAKIHLVGLRAFQEQMYYYEQRPRSFEARDAGMAYVAQEIRALRFPGTKTALWAHNAHLAAGGRYLPETLDMGYFLREDLGARYEAVGLVALETEIDWPGIGCGLARVAEPGSLEDFLAGYQEPYLLIDLDFPGAEERPFDPDAAWLIDGGVVVPSEEYRALVYLDRAEKMVPVGRPACD